MPTDDDSTPRTNKRNSGEIDITTFRLDRIDGDNQTQSHKLDKIDRLLTRHIERQDNHDLRLSNLERGFFRIIWTTLLGCATALGGLIIGLIPHSDKVAK